MPSGPRHWKRGWQALGSWWTVGAGRVLDGDDEVADGDGNRGDDLRNY
ncbi:MAG: hypothetical protein NTW21_21555 [Verrucomicrobia bacterium]|nr:hypothetical protein [Verrucomicrobiota bacterium]